MFSEDCELKPFTGGGGEGWEEKLIAKTHVETFWNLFHDLHDNYVSIIST